MCSECALNEAKLGGVGMVHLGGIGGNYVMSSGIKYGPNNDSKS